MVIDSKREELKAKEQILRDSLTIDQQEIIDKETLALLEQKVYLVTFNRLMDLRDVIDKEIAKRTLEDLFWNDPVPNS